MILRMIVKITLEENDGTVIKEQEYGKAYLEDIDMVQAAKDHWYTKFWNAKNQSNKKKYPDHSKRIYKIVDILTNQLKSTLLGRFLCRSGDVWEEYKDEL